MAFEQPQAIRTVFFDAGFTLLAPNPSIPEVCRQVCQRLNLHINLEAVRERMTEAQDYYLRHMRLNRHTWGNERAIAEFWTGYYMNILRPFVEEHNEQRLYQLARAINEEFKKHTSWQMYDDVLPTLKALKKHGYALGVISDWGIALGPILSRLKLTHYFDCLLISAVIRHAKPSPALYELALERANAISDYTLHIGDSYIHDVLGARAVGITPVLLDRSQHLKAENVDCLLVHSLYGLLDLLEVPRPES
ncbi:MAG TPA: HAD-IA family hydrolase [Ktedonobacteraceae bacterium]|nr:HAD-IA family hydrolase [Ktedonobacteraceae bacterium]